MEKPNLSVANIKTNLYLYMIKKILFFQLGRNIFFNKFKKQLYTNLVEEDTSYPKEVQIRKYHFLLSMISCSKRNIDKGWISKDVADRIVDTFAKYNFVERGKDMSTKEKFKEKYGIYPTSFILLSPTQRCNLNCEGCYASAKLNAPTLPFETVDKIVGECYNEFGNRFITISGGEPFLYSDDGKSLMDIYEKYPEMFFLVYTNGTVITKEVAEKLAELKNVTPAISIEGWEHETDERRGKGVYKKVLEAMKNLREAGVPFGVSITGTSKNVKTLLDDKFYDYLFQDLGVTYIWLFQLMPIGQATEMKELMVKPKDRVALYKKWDHLLQDKSYCIGDFWNSGVLSDGCVAYGRNQGYFYIDWNGKIMPCVFVPFYEDNVKDLYKEGKTLGHALQSNLFKRGRKWQDEYGLNHTKKPNNWLMPCSIKDHFENFKENIFTKEAKPEDESAAEFIKSPETEQMLKEFGKELTELTEPIWREEYLKEKVCEVEVPQKKKEAEEEKDEE